MEYAADLPSDTFGSGFPVSSKNENETEAASNLFYLNNLAKAPGNLFKISHRKTE